MVRTGYVQIAGFASGREPDDDAANYVQLLTQLVEAGYRGYVDCEYRPRGVTTNGLGWLSRVRQLTSG
jgi:hydroxypyruvate isomerase